MECLMLSILIPTYNYDCYRLVCDLQAQAMECGCRFEIIVADDASPASPSNLDRIGGMTDCRLIRAERNMGRSNIRNFLADNARYPYLLFIDADAEVCRCDYIAKYLDYCAPGCCVAGGIAYEDGQYRPEYSLRLKYGRMREANPDYPKQFTAFNLLIDRDLFMSVRFDGSLTAYGYEDFLFGADSRISSRLTVIDNPLIHAGLDDNMQYIRKVEEACTNMLRVYRANRQTDLYASSKLMRCYRLMEKTRCRYLAAMMFPLLKGILLRNLTSPDPSMSALDIYKLLYTCHISVRKLM